jgi:hypothetical protein
MQINIIIRSSVGTDGAVSKNQTDDESGTYTVTLSAAKGLLRWAERCFAEFTLSGANVLSMTGLSPIRMPESMCSCALSAFDEYSYIQMKK